MTVAVRPAAPSSPRPRGCTFSPLLVASGTAAQWAVPTRDQVVALPAPEALRPAATARPEPGPASRGDAAAGAAVQVPSPRRPGLAPVEAAPGEAAPTASRPEVARPERDRPAVDHPPQDGAPSAPGPPGGREQRRDPELRRNFGALLRDLTGSEVLTQQAVTLLRAVVDRSSQLPGTAPDQDALAAAALLEDLGRDLAAAQARLDEAERAHQEEQLERALAEQTRLEAERRLRELQRQVQRSGVDLDVWSAPPVDQVEAVPGSMAELLERLQRPQLERVVFTGDHDPALELDDVVHTGLHVQRTWEALLALRDYAAAKAAGTLDSDVQGYLERTPDGLCSWPAGRHARCESATVQNDPRLRAPRLLPVPPEVDPSGRTPMWAHLKLLSLGQTSPRLHYLDDTRRTGRVYVGYIGRHLPNTQTS